MSKHEACLIGVIIIGVLLHIVLWRHVIVGVFRLILSKPQENK